MCKSNIVFTPALFFMMLVHKRSLVWISCFRLKKGQGQHGPEIQLRWCREVILQAHQEDLTGLCLQRGGVWKDHVLESPRELSIIPLQILINIRYIYTKYMHTWTSPP